MTAPSRTPEARRAYAKRIRADRIAAGLCIRSGCRKSPEPGHRQCAEHLADQVLYSQEHYAKKAER